jgi:hypothetical protein
LFIYSLFTVLQFIYSFTVYLQYLQFIYSFLAPDTVFFYIPTYRCRGFVGMFSFHFISTRVARWYIFIVGNFWKVLQWKMLVHFMPIWSIFWVFGMLKGHLLDFVVIWYIFPPFGKFYQEKSGNNSSAEIVSNRK